MQRVLLAIAFGFLCYAAGVKYGPRIDALDTCPFPPRSENIKIKREILAQMLASPKLQVLMHDVDAEPNGTVRVDALYCEAFQ